MRYEIKDSKLIHFDKEGLFLIDFKNGVLQKRISVEIYEAHPPLLPLIMVGQIRVINKASTVFIFTLHTKVKLTFVKGENPINELAAMINKVNVQENEVFKNEMASFGIEFLGDNFGIYPEVVLNKSIEIRDIAKQQNLI